MSASSPPAARPAPPPFARQSRWSWILLWVLAGCLAAVALAGILLTVPTYRSGTARLSSAPDTCARLELDPAAGCFQIRLTTLKAGSVPTGTTVHLVPTGSSADLTGLVQHASTDAGVTVITGSITGGTTTADSAAATILVGRRALAEVFLGRGLRAGS